MTRRVVIKMANLQRMTGGGHTKVGDHTTLGGTVGVDVKGRQQRLRGTREGIQLEKRAMRERWSERQWGRRSNTGLLTSRDKLRNKGAHLSVC